MKKVLFIGCLYHGTQSTSGGEHIKSSSVLNGLSHCNDLNIDSVDISGNKISYFKFIFKLIFKKYDYVIVSKFPKGFIKILKTIKAIKGNTGLSKTIYFLVGRRLDEFMDSNTFLRNNLRLIKMVVVETPTIEKTLHKFGLTNVCIYPQIKDFPESYNNRHSETENLKALYFSRLHKEKAIIPFLQELVKKDITNINLDIFGQNQLSSDDYAILEAITKNNPNIRYLGCFSGTERERYELISGYDIHVLPSMGEGMPGSVVEAIHVGVPTLINEYDGSHDVVNENTGFFFKYNDFEEGASKLVYLSFNISAVYSKRQDCIDESYKYSLSSFVSFINNRVK